MLHSFLATKRSIEIHPDIVHIHNIGAALFSGMLVKKGIPVVLTFHSANYEHDKWGFLAKRILRLCEREALKNSSRIIFVNRFQMIKYSPDIIEKSTYIPNGVDEQKGPTSTSALDEIGVESGKFILAVGRVTPEKGLDVLIKAFTQLVQHEYKLVIAGGIEYEKKYYHKLKDLSSEEVIFVGGVQKDILNELYANAALFVLPSRSEGFPLVLLEALSFGLDVVVSDIPACHLIELNKNDYFPCGNEKVLSELIQSKLSNPQKRQYDLAEFSWDFVANKTFGEYEKARRTI